jgi:hypothetical protein
VLCCGKRFAINSKKPYKTRKWDNEKFCRKYFEKIIKNSGEKLNVKMGKSGGGGQDMIES